MTKRLFGACITIAPDNVLSVTVLCDGQTVELPVDEVDAFFARQFVTQNLDPGRSELMHALWGLAQTACIRIKRMAETGARA